MRLPLKHVLAACVALSFVACGGGDPTPMGAGAAPSETTPGPGGDAGSKAPRSPETGPEEPVENPAPEFEAETFEGRSFSLAEQRGTPVVLNFWESW